LRRECDLAIELRHGDEVTSHLRTRDRGQGEARKRSAHADDARHERDEGVRVGGPLGVAFDVRAVLEHRGKVVPREREHLRNLGVENA
jgi:hypothetical protein